MQDKIVMQCFGTQDPRLEGGSLAPGLGHPKQGKASNSEGKHIFKVVFIFFLRFMMVTDPCCKMVRTQVIIQMSNSSIYGSI